MLYINAKYNIRDASFYFPEVQIHSFPARFGDINPDIHMLFRLVMFIIMLPVELKIIENDPYDLLNMIYDK